MSYADFVARLKDKTEKALKWSELNAAGTVPDVPRFNFEELNDLILGETNNQLHYLSLNRFFIFLGIYQLKQAKSYTIRAFVSPMENMQ